MFGSESYAKTLIVAAVDGVNGKRVPLSECMYHYVIQSFLGENRQERLQTTHRGRYIDFRLNLVLQIMVNIYTRSTKP